VSSSYDQRGCPNVPSSSGISSDRPVALSFLPLSSRSLPIGRNPLPRPCVPYTSRTLRRLFRFRGPTVAKSSGVLIFFLSFIPSDVLAGVSVFFPAGLLLPSRDVGIPVLLHSLLGPLSLYVSSVQCRLLCPFFPSPPHLWVSLMTFFPFARVNVPPRTPL